MPQKQEVRSAVNLVYEVVVSEEALSDLQKCIRYLVNVKQNPQAAPSVLDDYEETVSALSSVAGSLKECDSPNMKARNLRRINFLHHNYFMLYLLEGQTAYITNIFHELEDADNKLR